MKTTTPIHQRHSLAGKLPTALGALSAFALTLPPLAAQTLMFNPQVDYATRDNPWQVAIADFNADLVPDFAVCNAGAWMSGSGGNSISVYLGNGDGSFQPQVVYSAGIFPMGILQGDFNNDAAPDLVAVNRRPAGGNSWLSVFLNQNNGTGTFLPPINVPSFSQPIHAAAGFLDADNRLDIAVAVHGSNRCQILLGNGNGTFVSAGLIPVGSGPNGIAISDFNNDNIADIATANWWSYDVTVLIGNGNGTFSESYPRPGIGRRTWSHAAADLNNDGNQDIAAPSALDSTMSILLGNGNGTFQPQMVFPTGTNLYEIQIADMDVDGVLDIVGAGTGLRIFYGNGDGTFQPPQVIPAPLSFPGIGIANLDGDCDLDVVTTGNGFNIASVFLQNLDPVANAGADQTVECEGMLTEVQLDGSTSDDCDGDSLTYAWSAAGAIIDDPAAVTTSGWFPLGSTLVTLTVDDGRGGSDSVDVLVVVEDTIAPVAVCTTDGATLWPPNHKMIEVQIFLSITDSCASTENHIITGEISSSEPDDAKGDGKRTGDVDGQDGYVSPVPVTLAYDSSLDMFTCTVELRAERDGRKVGRTYSITCEVTDPSGNSSTASCVVLVPHDKGK